MISKPKAIIVDLDGTLCNAKHRLHHIEKAPKDWDAFFAAAHADEPNQWCVDLIRGLHKLGEYQIVFLTGRGEEDRKLTERWLLDHLPAGLVANSDLLMRPADDRRKDTQVKTEIYETQIAPNYRVMLAIDDRCSVIQMWRGLGVPALACDDWESRGDGSHNAQVAKYFEEKKAKGEPVVPTTHLVDDCPTCASDFEGAPV
jgi:hypothetical protein